MSDFNLFDSMKIRLTEKLLFGGALADAAKMFKQEADLRDDEYCRIKDFVQWCHAELKLKCPPL